MKLTRLVLLLVAPLALASAWRSDAAGGVDPAYEQAAAAFRTQRYPAAYGLYTRLADAGHAPSARLALVMADHGALLFGRAWYASPDQQRRWNALVANDARTRTVAADSAAGD
jgi:hypothetical protein